MIANCQLCRLTATLRPLQRETPRSRGIHAVNRLETFGSVGKLIALVRASPRTRAMAAVE
jgi:hypothetical protein